MSSGINRSVPGGKSSLGAYLVRRVVHAACEGRKHGSWLGRHHREVVRRRVPCGIFPAAE